MKNFSIDRLAEIVSGRRHSLKLSQAELSKRTGLNRSTISKLEQKDYTPSISQLQALSWALDLDMTEVFVEDKAPAAPTACPEKRYNIAVAGTGYVGLSIATLLHRFHSRLLQHNLRQPNMVGFPIAAPGQIPFVFRVPG